MNSYSGDYSSCLVKAVLDSAPNDCLLSFLCALGGLTFAHYSFALISAKAEAETAESLQRAEAGSLQDQPAEPQIPAAPAAGAQLQPQISKGINSTLAVWADGRNLLGFFP